MRSKGDRFELLAYRLVRCTAVATQITFGGIPVQVTPVQVRPRGVLPLRVVIRVCDQTLIWRPESVAFLTRLMQKGLPSFVKDFLSFPSRLQY